MRGEGDATGDLDDVETHEAAGGLQLDEDEKEEQFEPFNLKSEREEGYFDDDGNYVEYKLRRRGRVAQGCGRGRKVRFGRVRRRRPGHGGGGGGAKDLSEVQIARMKGS